MSSASTSTSSSTSTYDRATGSRLKRDENSIRWVELLDKFKSVQEKARRAQRASQRPLDPDATGPSLSSTGDPSRSTKERASVLPDTPRGIAGAGGGNNNAIEGRGGGADAGTPKTGSSILGGAHRHKSSLSNLGRLGIGGRKSKR